MDSIQNWYEKIVFEKILALRQEQVNEDDSDPEDSLALWSDVACLALNHLPPRYVRHSVDMTFYLSPQEQGEMDQRVDTAINNALTYVRQHPSTTKNQANVLRSVRMN